MAVVFVTLGIIWLWIVYEMWIFEVDEKGNVIPKKKIRKK